MKKLSAILVCLLLAFICFATACTPPGGTGSSSGEGGLTSQEVSNLYREMAVQMWGKIGASVTLPSQKSGNTNFAVIVPDKKTETTDEGAIKNIQMNAKDAGGIMYLMSLLYAHEDYVTVDGLAGFDATYTQLGQGITQTIYLNTAINKDTGTVNFEAMVLTPQYDTWGYTNAEFTFDFSSSTLVECRFMMGDDADCVDMMLTSDGRYMWYRTDQMDDFASALLSLKEEFVQRYSGIQKLTTNFGPQMEEYIRATFEVEQQINSGNPSNPGEENPSNPEQPGEGGGVVEEQTKPNQGPTNAQVSAEDWDRLLSELGQVEKHITRMGYGPMWQTTTEISYRCDGYKIEKFETSFVGDQISSECFFNKEGDKYYRYDLTMGEFDKIVTETEITEEEYNQEMAMAKLSFLSMFEFEDFYYHELGFYSLTSDAYDKYAQYGIVSVEISFRDGRFEGINLIYRESGQGENDVQYHFSFSPDTGEVQIPKK